MGGIDHHILYLIISLQYLTHTGLCVNQCYVGVLDIYMNPVSLTMMDMFEVNTFKLMDCRKAHYDKEIIQVNERRYEFGDEDTTSDWVCAKIPNDGRIKKDCIPKDQAPGWYKHLLDNRDYQGCNGGVCYCDDQDGCNKASNIYSSELVCIFPVMVVLASLI